MSESHGTATPVPFDRKVFVPEHVGARRLDDESVLLNYDSESYFGLDPVGTRMWEVLSEAPTIEEGVDRLLAEFEVDPERLRRDITTLMRNLVDGGLVELRPV